MNLMMVRCPSCREYDGEYLGKHWRGCQHPDFSDRQEQIIHGLLMGDGSVLSTGHNDFLKVSMVNQPFLNWLDEEFSILSTGVKLESTSEELVERNKDNDLFQTINPEKYHDIYRFQSRRHPRLNDFRDMYYTDDGKETPDIELTPLIAKVWFACDGSLCWDRDNRAYVRFGIREQKGRENFFVSMFARAGFDINRSGWNYKMKSEESDRFIEWLGEAPPGFEYKFELHDKDRYETLMANQYEV